MTDYAITLTIRPHWKRVLQSPWTYRCMRKAGISRRAALRLTVDLIRFKARGTIMREARLRESL